MTQWNWWLALSKDERIELANAQFKARQRRDQAENHAAEAERIYDIGRSRAGVR